MAFKRKTDTTGGDQFKFDKKGQSLTGFYLGSFDFEGDYGPTKKHLFKTDKGIRVVFGQSHLTSLLEGENVGTLMRVTYESDKKGKKGNPMKMYTLDIDDEQVLDANEIPDESELSASESEVADVGEVEDDEVSDDEERADEIRPSRPSAPVRAATAPTPQKRADVAAMLSKNRRA